MFSVSLAATVLQVFSDQRAGGQRVQAVGHSLVAAGDDTADEHRVVLDVDNEAAVASLQTCLFRGGFEVALHLALRHVARDGAAAIAVAQGARNTRALLLGFVVAGVLQCFNAQVFADRRDDLLALARGAYQRSVAPHCRPRMLPAVTLLVVQLERDALAAAFSVKPNPCEPIATPTPMLALVLLFLLCCSKVFSAACNRMSPSALNAAAEPVGLNTT